MSKKLISYKLQASRGFTLIELLVSIGLLAVVTVSSYFAYLNFQSSHSLASYQTQTVSTFIQAQNLAMSRVCTQNCQNSTSGENFGIHFDAVNSRVVLFRGIIYNPSDNYNINLNFPNNLSITYDLPIGESNIIFDKVTGAVRNFDQNHHSFTITEKNTSSNKIFTFNKWGVLDTN